MPRPFWIALLLAMGTVPALRAADVKLTPDQLDFFEKKVRPVLVENCYKCHSHDSEKIKGGLLLDTRDGALKGGDTGPAVVPGNLDKSLLVKAVRYTDKDLQMPPNDRQLAVNEIRDLETWVKMGAPDPRTNQVDNQKYTVDFDKARQHWSFLPVTNPPVPQPADPGHWAQTPVDDFILDTLRSKKLQPSPPADKVTLLRRATFDLIGLPPTPKEVDDFLADTSTNAFATVVDRLLDSPHYGERWARHWLDLAHYSDTKGTGNRDDIYPYAYTYRDYVIRAFNEDLPYDQFLIQQIAADKLPPGDDKRPLVAMGFLTLNNRFNNQANDIIDDRIDIVAKGTMALTVTCARCHDHKFDPILTKDYYALHGVFNSSIEPKEEPLLFTPTNTPAYLAFTKEFAARQGALDSFNEDVKRELRQELINKSGGYMFALQIYATTTNNPSRNAFMEKRELSGLIAGIWDNNLKNEQRAQKNQQPRHSPIFAPWFAFSRLTNDDFVSRAKELAEEFHANTNKDKPINPVIADLFATPPASMAQVAARYTSVFTGTEKHWQQALADLETKRKLATNTLPDLKGLTNAAEEQIRQFMYANNSPMALDEGRLNNLINRNNKLKNKLNELQNAVSDLVLNHPGSPARAPVLVDDKPRDSAIFIKGNPGTRGPVEPRHFLSLLAGDNPPKFKDGSGRLELARDIASRDNPLTARVIINRIWLNHFGDGLVRTPDDFGTRGEAPAHPELLDYLASRFMDEGWSIKKMHRLIMLSSVYQQSSEPNPKQEQLDPDNRWLWRMNRRRLDFEELRDTILAVGGDLDLTMGGKPVKLEAEPYPLRRTVYGFVDRRNVPNMFQAFDFASPDLTTGRRETSLVPQQALFLMNNPMVVEQARNLVRRMNFKPQSPAEARIEAIYKVVYQRKPTEAEVGLALDYLRADSTADWQTNAQAAWQYGYGQYDPALKRTKMFVMMGNFSNRAWLPAGKPPDEKLRGLSLGPDGGNPNANFAVIRRWVAPRDGYISIEGALAHTGNQGDGVEGRIVSSRAGELGSWVAFNSREETKIPRIYVGHGDTVDFITDGREDPKNDAFKWAPVIKMEPSPIVSRTAIAEWNAQKDFAGDAPARRMTTWDKYAQVLLEANELAFVN